MNSKDIGKAIHSLEGILHGIGADTVISPTEVDKLKIWMEHHLFLEKTFPFSEIYRIVEDIKKSSFIEEDLYAELMDYCKTFFDEDGTLDFYERDMRRLHGYLSGIIIDKKVNIDELSSLLEWLETKAYLKEEWPFKDVYQLLKNILKDKKVSDSEEKEFIKFASSFSEEFIQSPKKDPQLFDMPWLESNYPIVKTIELVLEDIDISLTGKKFCVTGQCQSGTRKFIQDKIISLGGSITKEVNTKTDYLVIGKLSNPNWAYATYGKKVEKTMRLKEEGYPISIISEELLMRSL